MRDAALLKTVYAFGLRRNEARMLDLADLRRTPKSPQYRQYGGVFVRYGKASKGSPPKRRTVLTVPEMDWIVGVLDQWVTESGRCSPRAAIPRCSSPNALAAYRCAGSTPHSDGPSGCRVPSEEDLHSLRHSYVTHLVEFDYPEKFVSLQVGHEYASTTAIYTGVSDEYRNRLIQRLLKSATPIYGKQ